MFIKMRLKHINTQIGTIAMEHRENTKAIKTQKAAYNIMAIVVERLDAWLSDRTSVSGRRTLYCARRVADG